MANSSEAKYLDDVTKYFTTEEWNNMSDYEKIRIKNSYEIYVDMITSGFKINKPDFIIKYEELANKNLFKKREIDLRSKVTEQNDESVKALKPQVNTRSRYPKRNIPAKNYTEEDFIPDDRFVYCDICMNEFVDNCNVHETILLPDNPVPITPTNPNRARETVPKGWLNICSSKIYNGGEGVWTLRKLRIGIRFGPYEGKNVQEEQSNQYSWQIKKNGKIVSYIDGGDTSTSNWMRYVNCARNKAEQNLMAFQYLGKIYYRTIVDISVGTELLVFYGPQFAKELGIDTKNYNTSPENPPKDNVFQCENCNLAFSSPIYLDSHVNRCRNKKVTNSEKRPRKNYQIKDARNTIEDTNNNNEVFKCHLCDMAYTIKSLYNYHLITKHCLYDYNPKNNTIDQKNVEKNSDILDGTTESTSTTTVDSGYNDEPRIIKNKRPYKCTYCHKAFRAPYYLKIHIRIHTGERPFKCNTCDKTFNIKYDLTSHQRIHSGEKPYECDICYKKFTVLSSLTRHKRTHTKECPYICTICQKTCTTSSNLYSHKLKHTDERPHECNVCHKRFTYRFYLKTHIRIHTGEKPFSCSYCQKAFSSKSNLRSHERTHHKNQN